MIGEENEATSLLVLPGERGEKKARLAARWLESGWAADIIERRHHGDIPVTVNEPPYLLCGLDCLEPRVVMARHGFELMIDAGFGRRAERLRRNSASHGVQRSIDRRPLEQDHSDG